MNLNIFGRQGLIGMHEITVRMTLQLVMHLPLLSIVEAQILSPDANWLLEQYKLE